MYPTTFPTGDQNLRHEFLNIRSSYLIHARTPFPRFSTSNAKHPSYPPANPPLYSRPSITSIPTQNASNYHQAAMQKYPSASKLAPKKNYTAFAKSISRLLTNHARLSSCNCFVVSSLSCFHSFSVRRIGSSNNQHLPPSNKKNCTSPHLPIPPAAAAD